MLGRKSKQPLPPTEEPKEGKKGVYISSEYVFPGACNGIVCAGAGAGKGVDFIIPNLLGAADYPGSWVVIDPKGQNAYISAKFQKSNGNNVIILNPWGLYAERLGTSDYLNPLDLLEPSEKSFFDDCKMLAHMMIPDTSSKDKHWERRARAFLVMCLALMKTERFGNTLQDLQDIVSGKARSQKGTEHDINGLAGIILQAKLSDNRELARLGYQFESTWGILSEPMSKEMSGILSTVYDNLFDLASESILNATQETSFELSELCEGLYSIYLVIPSERLESGSRWLRLVIATLMRSIIRGNGERRGAKYPYTFLLDEFASLGHMKEVETAVQQYRGYNIFSIPILQDLSQLKNLYPQTWQVFMNCALLQIYFGINVANTAEFVSKMAGYISVPGPTVNSLPTRRERFTVQEVLNRSYKEKFIKLMGTQLLTQNLEPYHENEDLNARAHYPIPNELR